MVECYFLSNRKHQLLEDVYRANLNLGHICFRRSQHSGAVRCLEQARECARKMKDKFSESECCHWIGKVRTRGGGQNTIKWLITWSSY